MCDRFGDSCGASDAAKAACITATAATKGKTGQAAGKLTPLSTTLSPSLSSSLFPGLFPPLLAERGSDYPCVPSRFFFCGVEYSLTERVATAWNEALGLTNVPNLTGA